MKLSTVFALGNRRPPFLISQRTRLVCLYNEDLWPLMQVSLYSSEQEDRKVVQGLFLAADYPGQAMRGSWTGDDKTYHSSWMVMLLEPKKKRKGNEVCECERKGMYLETFWRHLDILTTTRPSQETKTRHRPSVLFLWRSCLRGRHCIQWSRQRGVRILIPETGLTAGSWSFAGLPTSTLASTGQVIVKRVTSTGLNISLL